MRSARCDHAGERDMGHAKPPMAVGNSKIAPLTLSSFCGSWQAAGVAGC